MVTSYGVGQYSTHDAAGAHQWGTPRGYKADGTRRLIVWCHSAGGSAAEPWTPGNNVLPALETIFNLGLPVISADMSGVGWGNDASQTALLDAITYAASALNPITSKVILCGVSMGGMLALNWARANPTKVSGIALFYPATSLQAIHDGTGGAANGATSTEAAYGGSLATFNAAVATHDPAQNTAAIAALGVPMKMWYSTADTTVGTANQTAFATAVGGALQTKSLGAVSHADMTQINKAELQAFIASCA